MEEKNKIPQLLHLQHADLKRLLRPVEVRRFYLHEKVPEVEFEKNDIVGFLTTVRRALLNLRGNPITTEEYGLVSKEFRYTIIINGIAYWLVVQEAAIEKSKNDAESLSGGIM